MLSAALTAVVAACVAYSEAFRIKCEHDRNLNVVQKDIRTLVQMSTTFRKKICRTLYGDIEEVRKKIAHETDQIMHPTVQLASDGDNNPAADDFGKYASFWANYCQNRSNINDIIFEFAMSVSTAFNGRNTRNAEIQELVEMSDALKKNYCSTLLHNFEEVVKKIDEFNLFVEATEKNGVSMDDDNPVFFPFNLDDSIFKFALSVFPASKEWSARNDEIHELIELSKQMKSTLDADAVIVDKLKVAVYDAIRVLDHADFNVLPVETRAEINRLKVLLDNQSLRETSLRPELNATRFNAFVEFSRTSPK